MLRKGAFFSLIVIFAVVSYWGVGLSIEQKNKYDSILGVWSGEIVAPHGTMEFTLDISLKEDKIFGMFDSANLGEGEMRNIELTKNTLTFDFTMDVDHGTTVEFEVTAEIDKNEMKGNFVSQMGEAPFTAEKDKKRKKE